MPYASGDIHYVLDTFGKQTVEQMVKHRREDEAEEVLKRIAIRKRADQLRSEGCRVSVSMPDEGYTTEVVIRCKFHVGQETLTGEKAREVIAKALAIRDGFMSKVIPLRLTDVLLDILFGPESKV